MPERSLFRRDGVQTQENQIVASERKGVLVFGRPEEDRKSFLRGRKKLPPLALVPRLCLGTHCPRGPRAQALPAEPGHEENFALPEACCRLSGCLPALSSACPGRICRPRWNSWIETLFRRRSNSWSRIRLAQFTPEGRLYYFPIPGSAPSAAYGQGVLFAWNTFTSTLTLSTT